MYNLLLKKKFINLLSPVKFGEKFIHLYVFYFKYIIIFFNKVNLLMLCENFLLKIYLYINFNKKLMYTLL